MRQILTITGIRQLLTMIGVFIVAIYVTFTFMLPGDGVAHSKTPSAEEAQSMHAKKVQS